jgi:trigger factor
LVWVKVPEERTAEGKKKTVLADKLLELERAVEHLHLPAEGPLTFSCEVELRPEFELPKIEGIPIERHAVEITEEMVDGEIDRIRATRGQFAPVEGGKVKADDLLVADYKCTVGDRVLAATPNRTLAARDQALEKITVEGLGKALVGKKVDDAVSVEATVPDDYEDGELRGKQAKFELTVRDIKRLKLPELDEEFLASLGVDTKDELIEAVRGEMEVRRDQMARDQMRSSVRDYLLGNIELELPEGLSRRQTDRAVARRMIDLYRMGIPQQEVEKRIDELKASAAEEAVEDLKFFFIMEKIAEDLEVKVTEEEINAVIGAIAQRSGQRFDRVRDELGRSGLENLYVKLRDEKILDKLIQDAEVTDVAAEPPKKKPARRSGGKAKAKAKAAKPKAKAKE